MAKGDLEQELDELFATPPEDFVATRNALVKRLRAEKHRDEAAEVASLRRPTRAVSALNRLALSGDPVVDRVLAAVEASRDPGDDVRGAFAELREAVNAASRRAVELLDDARPSDNPELSTALHTVVGDNDALEAFRSGRLEEIPEAGASAFGLAAVPGAGPTAPRRPAKPRKKAAEETAAEGVDELAVRRAEKAVAAAGEAVDAAQAARRQAEADSEEAAERLATAEAALAQAEAERDRAAVEAEEAAGRLREAQAAEEAAGRTLAEARSALDDLEG